MRAQFLHTCGVKVGDDEEVRSDLECRSCAHVAQSTVQPSDVVRFAREPLNGRVIKRLLQTAQSLALVEQRPLSTGALEPFCPYKASLTFVQSTSIAA